MTDNNVEQELGQPEWEVNHQCRPVWRRGAYSGVRILVCDSSAQRGFHVISWEQPTVEMLWTIQLN